MMEGSTRLKMLSHVVKVREIQFPGNKLDGGHYYTGNRNVSEGVEVGVFGRADALIFSSRVKGKF